MYLEKDSVDLISNYEDVSIKKSVENQLKFAKIENVKDENDSDIVMVVNNFKSNQGEIVMKKDTEQFSGELVLPDRPYMIADVRNANGADNNFMDELIKKFRYDDFYGYGGWNTSANTVGSLLCCAKVKYSAQQKGTYNDTAFKKVQMVRFLDDWAYQANIRQQITEPCNIQPLMKQYEETVSKILGLELKNEYFYPWNRLFEIEVEDELR